MRLAGLAQKKSMFASRLCGLVIDEAHLVYVWRQFRSNYAALSRMRTLWPKVPIMTLSATFAPHVASYVHKSLELMTGAKLIRRQIDRPNIFLARRPISNQSSFEDLDFIIPNYECDIRLIPKTMIFVDSRPMVCALTDYLLKNLSLAWIRSYMDPSDAPAPPEDVVADYTTILSQERRTQVLAKFYEGTCRVIVCTDAAGMGIDIRDVQRVIQWKATSILNLASYFQRVGRAGRDASYDSVAIFFHQSSLAQLDNEYALYKEDIEGRKGVEVLKNIRAFDRGTDDGVLVRRGKRSLKNVLQNRGLEFGQSAQNEESSTDPRKLICRGLLNQIGTTGCMRSAILRYFDFPNSDVPPERCCDSCLQRGNLEVPVSVASLLPEHIVENFEGDPDESEDEDEEEQEGEVRNLQEEQSIMNLSQPITIRRARIPALTPAQIETLQSALRSLRHQIWSSQLTKAVQYRLSPFRETIFLTDLEVSRLSMNAHKIQQLDHIAKHLNANKNFQWTLIAPYISDVFKCIQDTYAELAPTIAPVIRRKPITIQKSVSQQTDQDLRKRQLKREANQRYYAKQKALRMAAAKEQQVLSDISNVHHTSNTIAISGLSHPPCGTTCGSTTTAPNLQIAAINPLPTATTLENPAPEPPFTATPKRPTAKSKGSAAISKAPTACGDTSRATPAHITTVLTDNTQSILQELPTTPNTIGLSSGSRIRKNPSWPTDKENSAKRVRIL